MSGIAGTVMQQVLNDTFTHAHALALTCAQNVEPHVHESIHTPAKK